MATCKTCGNKIPIFQQHGELCYDCFYKEDAARLKAEREAEESAAKETRAAIDAVMITTETAAPDLKIAARLGIVTAECAFGMNLFKDIFAVGRDIFGGRAASIQNALKDARNTALDELRLEASKLGANAVIAVDLDYSEISGGGKSMLFLVATGTAVRLG